MCFNRKVIIGLAAVAGGVLLFAPQTFGAVLPFLIVLACPLSMLLMMRRMAPGQSCGTAPSEKTSTSQSAAAAPSSDAVELTRLRAEVDLFKAELCDRKNNPLATETDDRA